MSIDNLQNSEVDSENIDTQAKQIAGLLDAHASRLSMRTLKQLENGRARAVKVHAQQISGVSINHDGTLSGISTWAEHHRIASTGLVLGVIIAGFVVMQSLSQRESSDAFLLGADLPPEAFVDRGFEPSLNDAQTKL
jgi:Protein of unknown function (DUF3619)